MSDTQVPQHSLDIPEAVKQKIWEAYGKLPLTFVPNTGHTHSSVHYYTQTSGYHIYFTPEEVVFVFAGNTPNNENGGLALSLQFLGANSSVVMEGQQKDTGKVNYFIGNDPTKWYTELPTYREVVYRELWPGIDLVFRGENGHLKYDFVVQPGANWKDIRIAYHGAEGLSLDKEGNLLISTSLGVLTEQRPVSYQEIEGQQNSVKSRFVVKRHANGESEYGFEVGNDYNSAYSLVI